MPLIPATFREIVIITNSNKGENGFGRKKNRNIVIRVANLTACQDL